MQYANIKYKISLSISAYINFINNKKFEFYITYNIFIAYIWQYVNNDKLFCNVIIFGLKINLILINILC